MGRTRQEAVTTFAEVIQSSNTSHPQNRNNNNDNRMMIYSQGLKLYIPDDFNPDTLLRLLQIIKKL